MERKFTQEYLNKIAEKYNSGQAREHAYRPALEKYFEEITNLNVVNDPRRSEFGAPDFIFLKGQITLAYAEAKDIGVSLDQVEKSEQLTRYYGYSNIILTDYLEFRFFRNGEKYCEPIKIAEIKNSKIEPIVNNSTIIEDTIREFINQSKEPIKSGKLLAKVMAGKARRIRDNINIFLGSNYEKKNEDLLSVYNAIKRLLVADLDYEKFADMYAQTLVYGLFAARYNDETKENFTRQEARDLIPTSNPFLREFFDHIAGSSFDKRIEVIVSELCEEFTHADVKAIIHSYFKNGKKAEQDPIIHFYEDFLQEYDSNERKKMGVFYTPLPVVSFIVRSIDQILKNDFGLKGLNDSSKIEIKLEAPDGKKYKKEVHKVQILDPATGTGTFLNEVILEIKKTFSGQEGRWSSYVKEDLLPRLHGFELMMAPYTIAHLKLASTLKESGVNGIDRIGVLLTNSLEKQEKEKANLFNYMTGLDRAITKESREAEEIKNNLPIMVILGNPPYSVSSSNKGEWIQDLIKVYKTGLAERNIQPLSDDYIKFIRIAEYLIEKNKTGVVAMITNNSFLNGKIHRLLRKHLQQIFSDIYIVNLHGSSRVGLQGNDENVFNIQQGVSINILIRKDNQRRPLGNVYYAEIFGKRDYKFAELDKNDSHTIDWQRLENYDPNYYFIPIGLESDNKFKNDFKVDELFKIYNAGSATGKDKSYVQMTSEEMVCSLKSIKKEMLNEKIIDYLYRPFDIRKMPYDKTLIQRLRTNVMDHMLESNLALTVTSQNRQKSAGYVFISKKVVDRHLLDTAGDSMYVFPLYIFNNNGTKNPNLKKEILDKIEQITGKTEPENILDYIYAVLHSPTYRAKYKEFLKIDFPRVPYPADKNQFFALAKIGEQLRLLHLMDNTAETSGSQTTYPIAGDNNVEKVNYNEKEKRAYINKTQYFGNVPKEAWEFYIGGYQPAQKWLKDRKGRELSSNDLVHYQKIVAILIETEKIMGGIDKITTF